MNNDRDNATTEVQLDWTSKKELGNEGLTHQATATIAGDEWAFVLDSPKKGLWVGRGWRNGNMALYREARTLKDVKAMAQSHAELAAAKTCAECRKIAGHDLDCAVYRRKSVEKSAARGERIALRDVAPGERASQQPLVIQATDEEIEYLAHFRDTLTEYAPRAVERAARSMRQFGWHMARACQCPTPSHRMSCGEGGRVRVLSGGAA